MKKRANPSFVRTAFLLTATWRTSLFVAPTTQAQAFANGADVGGWLQQMEAVGYKFYNE